MWNIGRINGRIYYSVTALSWGKKGYGDIATGSATRSRPTNPTTNLSANFYWPGAARTKIPPSITTAFYGNRAKLPRMSAKLFLGRDLIATNATIILSRNGPRISTTNLELILRAWQSRMDLYLVTKSFTSTM